MTFNANIKNKYEQTKDLFNRASKYGFDALVIKCCDLLDNIDYVEFVSNLETKQELIDKYKLFLEIAKKDLENEIIYQELICKINNLN